MIKKNYDFNISDVMREAWQKVKGVKSAYWVGLGLYFAIYLGISLLTMAVFFVVYKTNPHIKESLIHGLENVIDVATIFFIELPMTAGLILIGMRRSVEKSVSPSFVFKFFHWKYIWRFALAWWLMGIFVFVPGGLAAICLMVSSNTLSMPLIIVLHIVGIFLLLLAIYLFFCFFLLFPTIIDRLANPWQAIKISYRQISKHWFKFFSVNILIMLIMIVSALPLGIGLIWTLPLMNNLFGILYRELVGIEGLDPVTQKEK